MVAPITVQQPQPYDVVGTRVHVGGLGTGFEATLRARIRDGNGHELVSTFFMAGGGTGEIGQFHVEMELAAPPPTPSGFVEVWEDNAGYPHEGPYYGPVAEIHKVVVPVVFGTHLVQAFVGWRPRVVVDGDSLSRIAVDEYGDGSLWPAIFEANRDKIGDPDLIHAGLELRIPHHATEAETRTVEVYFLHQDRYVVGTEPYAEAVPRIVSAVAPATGALHALFAGPTAAEQAQSLRVVLSGATGFTDLTISNGIARVRLTGGCDSQGATFTIQNLIVPTLKQFDTIDHVKVYSPDGQTAQPDGPSDSMPGCLEP